MNCRFEREKLTKEQISKVLCHADYCQLAVSENNQPYVIPMFFEYADQCCESVFYLYSCDNGKKTKYIKENCKVCLNIVTEHNNKYYSVVVFGKAKMSDKCCGKEKLICVKVNEITGYSFKMTTNTDCCC